MPLLNSIAALGPEMKTWRRDIHMHPETSYEEHRTAAIVAEKLRNFEFDEVHTGIGITGVVGVLHGKSGPAKDESEAILLRADMDALPMEEENDFDHRSTIPGKMHACGHDGHTTMLMGAAKHLSETRNFTGTVYFCFQPAEEGGAGAMAMIKDGLFDRFPCRAVFGMHNWPGIPVGHFGTCKGPVMAAADRFTIKLNGRGSHAAKPNKSHDPIVCGAALVSALQTIVSRRVDPMDTAVLSVTQFHSGSTFNVIPDTAEIHGTVRTFSEEVHDAIVKEMHRVIEHTCASFEITADVKLAADMYPPTVNDDHETEFALSVAREVAGDAQVNGNAAQTMGAEDFSFLARERPGCFIFTGNGNSAALHNTSFDFNDEVSPWGVQYWTTLVERALPKVS